MGFSVSTQRQVGTRHAPNTVLQAPAQPLMPCYRQSGWGKLMQQQIPCPLWSCHPSSLAQPWSLTPRPSTTSELVTSPYLAERELPAEEPQLSPHVQVKGIHLHLTQVGCDPCAQRQRCGHAAGGRGAHSQAACGFLAAPCAMRAPPGLPHKCKCPMLSGRRVTPAISAVIAALSMQQEAGTHLAVHMRVAVS